MQHESAFTLNQKVKLPDSDTVGRIDTIQFIRARDQPSYWVNYENSNGDRKSACFIESELIADE